MPITLITTKILSLITLIITTKIVSLITLIITTLSPNSYFGPITVITTNTSIFIRNTLRYGALASH